MKRTKVHSGKLAKCPQCMKKVAEQDAEFAQAFTKAAASTEKPRRT